MRTENQDAYLIKRLGPSVLAAVADGIGGAPNGREASHLAVSALEDMAWAFPRLGAEHVAAAVRAANTRIRARSGQDPALAGMGTTLTLAWCDADRCVVGHVGDSRAYRFSGGQLWGLTQDHSVAGEMRAVGTLSAQEARVHPQRHVLTRALGPFAQITVDTFEGPFLPGDRLLLCTDGLTGVVEDAEIIQVLTKKATEAAAAAFCELAVQRGAPDNVTVVVIENSTTEGPGRGR